MLMRLTFQLRDSVQIRLLAQKINKIMSLANRTFKNNRTGESIKVIDTFENIAILENKQKIDVRTLMDPNQYTEQIDPSSFFNNQNAYNSLAEKIKNIPTEGIVDDSTQLNFGGEVNPSTNESAIIMTSEEDEMAELARKYGATLDNGDSVTKQQQAFAKLLGEEEPVTKIEVNNVQQVETSKEYIGDMPGHRNPPPPVQRVEVEDPIITMFRRTKRNVNFNINIEVSDKIPRLDFIEMMEDSYEISMIDFLADEFTNKILQDPSSIRNSIKEKIKQLVYGGGNQKTNSTKVEKNNKEDKDTNHLQRKESQITDSVTTKSKKVVDELDIDDPVKEKITTIRRKNTSKKIVDKND